MTSPASRVRPLRVFLGVTGALATTVLVWGAVAVGPDLADTYRGSRAAEVPALPAADPAAERFQASLMAADGSSWESVELPQSENPAISRGSFALSSGSCDYSLVQTSATSEYRAVSVGRVAVQSTGGGAWTSAAPPEAVGTPILVDPLTSGVPCFLVSDLGRVTTGLVAGPEVPGLPVVEEGLERYVGDFDVARLQQLATYRTYRALEELGGRVPTRDELSDATPSFETYPTAKVAVDVDDRDRPVRVSVVSTDGRPVAEIRFTGPPRDLDLPVVGSSVTD